MRLELTEAELTCSPFSLGSVLAHKQGKVMTMRQRVSYSSPPEECDVCNLPVRGIFYDCKTKLGPWGNLCSKCFVKHGIGLGVGKGQLWYRENDGKYYKKS